MGELANYGGFTVRARIVLSVRLAARISLFSLPSFGFVMACHISCWISWNADASHVPSTATPRFHRQIEGIYIEDCSLRTPLLDRPWEGAGEEPDTCCSWPAPILTGAHGGCSLQPPVGWRRSQCESQLLTLIPHLPLSSTLISRPRPPAFTQSHSNSAPLTANLPKTHPKIKHAHRTFFLSRVRPPLLRFNPAILPPRKAPSRPNTGANTPSEIRPCWTTINRP